MGDRIKLEGRGADIVAEALYGSTTLDFDAIRDSISDAAHEAADSVCIYYHHCVDIIQDYEGEYGADADDCGSRFKPSEWQQAAQAYAYGIARAAIAADAEREADALEEKADAMVRAIVQMLPECAEPIDADSLRVGRDCPYGWVPHDDEDEDGICYWRGGQLDGCNGVAVQSGAVWLYYSWQPKAEG